MLFSALFLHGNTYKDAIGMSKKQDRIDIAEKIKTAAILYKQNLVGKMLCCAIVAG